MTASSFCGTAVRLLLAGSLLVLPAAARPAEGQRTSVGPLKPPQAADPVPFGFRRVPDRLRRAQRFDARRLALWAAAVRGHQASLDDAAVVRVASWSPDELAELMVDLEDISATIETLVRTRSISVLTDGRTLPRVTVRDWNGTAAEALELLSLTPDEAWADGVTRLAQLGAILHTDAGVVAGEAASVADTVHTLGQTSLHFGFALALVDGLARTYPDNGFPLDWYRSVAGYLQRHREFHSAPLLVERALKRYRDDVYLLASAGCIHELLGSPLVQSRDVFRDVGWSPELESAESYLRKAERSFREVLRREPAHAEARIRLGHVLGSLGRHAEALAVLRSAPPPADDVFVSYFGWLFLGDEEAAAGHRDLARQAYGRALELSPRAQSVWLSISRLARQTGDRASALTAMRRTLESGSDTSRDDPWVNYDEGLGRQADQLMRQLWDWTRKQP